MKVAIFGRITDNTDFGLLADFFSHLEEEHIPFILYKPYAEQLRSRNGFSFPLIETGTFECIEHISDHKFMFCFGGDGTVLEAVNFLGGKEVPILSVNFGRLGYLASISQQELIGSIEKLRSDAYRTESRSLLNVVSDPPGIFGGNNFGINDLTVHKSNTNEMITVHTYINGEYLNSYWGDGIIVATPTGSTAYSLSCGGPIIFPSASTFAITPVAPHSLTVRPVVIPDDWVVSFQIESRSGEAMVALDNRSETVKAGTAIAVRCADFKVKLIRFSNSKYIDSLREGLMWGSDKRNAKGE